MSLPNYLLNIKSSGVYRYTWDKSVVPAVEAPTLRLLVGYSEKGPFNTPVYIDKPSDFIEIFGKVSKRLERKGVFFHRMALQALTAGPILALNLKSFDKGKTPDEAQAAKDVKDTKTTVKTVKAGTANPEQVSYFTIDPRGISTSSITTNKINVSKLYDTNRFWKLDSDLLPEKISNSAYMTIAATDLVDNSCSIYIRQYMPKDYDITIEEWYNSVLHEEIPDYLEGIKSNKLNKYFLQVYVFRGNLKQIDEDKSLLKNYINANGVINTNYTDSFGENADALAAMAEDDNSGFINVYSGCILPYFKDANGNYISLDLKFNADSYVHKMIMKLDEAKLTAEDSSKLNINGDIAIKVDGSAITYPALNPTYIEGYTYNSITSASTEDEIITNSLEMLNDKGIRKALTNNVDVQYHYLIDTFASTVNSGKNLKTCKSQLSAIAKTKDNSLAILNFPAMRGFMNDTDFSKNGKFDITTLSNNFHLPTETEGASYCAFYTPVVLSDGTVKTTCPSAALVSNNFMEKYASRQPYYIVAGSNYGRLSAQGLIGPDYNFGRDDLDVLEPMGVNAIVYVPRKGTFINSNQTAKQTPISALSKVHVRELIIYLQDEIEFMLQNYQWELNTQTLRDTIKAKADTILENVKNNHGIYAYANQCDEFNNTPEVIDNEMIILDTAIEPARGAGKMIQQITIHRTGALSSMTK